MKREVRVLETRHLRRGEELRTQLKDLAGELEAVRQELALRDQKFDRSTTLSRTLGSTVRNQALRMIKHGERPDRVASALNLPRNEVELLVRVQRLTASA